MNLTDEQRAALDRHWKELFEEPVTTETEMVAYGYFKRGYVAAKNETCEWALDVTLDGNFWTTECRESFRGFYRFCPNCGGKLEKREEK